jgi:hypothetical protein
MRPVRRTVRLNIRGQPMNQKIRDKAEKLFRSKYDQLTELEKHVAQHITERTPISTNIVQNLSEKLTFGLISIQQEQLKLLSQLVENLNQKRAH